MYFDDIRLLGSTALPPAAEAGVRILASGTTTPIDSRILGTNVATWNSPAVFENADFITFAPYSISLLRLNVEGAILSPRVFMPLNAVWCGR